MKKLLALAPCVLLAACITGTSPKSTFYKLPMPIAPIGPEENKVKARIVVEPVNMPAYLDRPQIVTLDKNGYEVYISETNRWAEPLTIHLQRTLSDYMSAYMPNALVKNKAHARDSYDYTVSIDINRLDAVMGSGVVLDAWYSINDKDAKTLSQRRFRMEEAIGDSYDDLMQAQGKLIFELSRDIGSAFTKIKH